MEESQQHRARQESLDVGLDNGVQEKTLVVGSTKEPGESGRREEIIKVCEGPRMGHGMGGTSLGRSGHGQGVYGREV